MGLPDPEMPTEESDVDSDMLYNYESWLARFCRIFMQPYIDYWHPEQVHNRLFHHMYRPN